MPDEPEDQTPTGTPSASARTVRSGRPIARPSHFGGEEATVSPGAAAPPVEPAAGPAWARPRLFCVQKHAATRLHDDLRVEVARAVHELAEQIGLPAYVKTSGSTGLHVLVPAGAAVGVTGRG